MIKRLKMKELPNDIENLQKLVLELLKRVEKLEAENAELKRQLGMNSQNSHKPPSSDGFKKVKKKSQLPKELKARGGQKGHKGKTLEQVKNPDYTKVYAPTRCSCCNRQFDIDEIEIIAKRQVFDIPPAQLEVTEHQLGSVECCGLAHKGSFPKEVLAPVQYGVGVKALTTMLSVDYRMPYQKMSSLFADIYGYAINGSTLLKNLKDGYTLLEPTEQRIKQGILKSYLAHFDETGIRCESRNYWLHTASTSTLTYLFVHQKRGKEALESMASIIKDFNGIAVHDCWASYFKFEACRHVLCGAHLLRELRALIEIGSKWAQSMFNFLIQLYKTEYPIDKVQARYKRILYKANKEEPQPIQGPKGRPKQSKGRCLYNRLKKYQNGVLAFVFDERIPFTNNQAERDIRPVKVKQKVSGGFRTFSGTQQYARIQAVISTLRKQSINVLDALRSVFNHSQIIALKT